MEERAKAVGKPNFFHYIGPFNNDGDGGLWLNASQASEVEGFGMGSRVAADLHVGAGGGIAVAKRLLNDTATRNLSFGVANLETNDGTHTMLRAAKEAADLNSWQNCHQVDGTGEFCERLLLRTASFCSGRSGHFDAYDQGMSFFLPNMCVPRVCPSNLSSVLMFVWVSRQDVAAPACARPQAHT